MAALAALCSVYRPQCTVRNPEINKSIVKDAYFFLYIYKQTFTQNSNKKKNMTQEAIFDFSLIHFISSLLKDVIVFGLLLHSRLFSVGRGRQIINHHSIVYAWLIHTIAHLVIFR